MTASPARRPLVVSFLFAASFALFGGCAAKTQSPAEPLTLETPKPTKQVVKEYKYVTRLGSYIPIRVPKDGITELPPGASPVQTYSGEVLRELVSRPMSGRR